MDKVMETVILILMCIAAVVVIYGLIVYIKNELSITWKHKPHGIAPVQAEGYFLGKYFYFRSRYETAVIQFADSEEDWAGVNILKKYVVYKSDNLYKASSIPYWKAKLFIYKGCLMYLLGFKSNV